MWLYDRNRAAKKGIVINEDNVVLFEGKVGQINADVR